MEKQTHKAQSTKTEMFYVLVTLSMNKIIAGQQWSAIKTAFYSSIQILFILAELRASVCTLNGIESEKSSICMCVDVMCTMKQWRCRNSQATPPESTPPCIK